MKSTLHERFFNLLRRRAVRFFLVCSLSLLVLQCLAAGTEAFQSSWFCAPSATLAGWILGVPSAKAGHVWTLFTPDRLITVGPSCSGFGFFSLLFSLSAGLAFRHRPAATAVVHATAMLPLSYGAILIINAGRIVASYHASLMTSGLPERLSSKVHLGTGIAVFLTSLVVITLVLERRYSDARV